jgi:uncharacterized membrane protein YgdD (TMEM256/DUF423 family)
MSSDRVFFTIGSLLAGTAVAAGAFGAHGLRGRVDPDLLEVFSTGARYQMFHALALLALAWAVTRWPGGKLEPGGWLLVAGTVIFSGSLYLMTFTGARWLGAVTPLGGLLLLGGWAVLVWRTARGPDLPDRQTD